MKDAGRDLGQFAAELWAWMDEQGRKDAALTMLAVSTTPAEQQAALLGALPPSMRAGPDSQGNYRGACGARRTPGPALLGPPCTSGEPCAHTASGLCWRRWSLDPNAAPTDLVAAAEVEVVETEVVAVAKVEVVEVAAVKASKSKGKGPKVATLVPAES